jgi:uncharacterized repeat protein (TIGR01451 family)
MLGFLLVCSTPKGIKVSASGTGIGIRVEGPPRAEINQTISYNITVINFGDYWDRNLTVTDNFPNGTSTSWKIPDLAPLAQPGYKYTIFDLLYVIRLEDVVSQPLPWYIDNNVTVTGYAYVTVWNVTVINPILAETSFPTVIGLPVGGYSISLEPACLHTPTITYFTLVFAVVAISGFLHFKFKHTKYHKSFSERAL